MSSKVVIARIERERGRRAALGMAAVVFVLVTVAPSPGRMARSAPLGAVPPRSAPVQSDFNGDGFADLAVAESQESIGSITLAGAVSVFYGSATGIAVAGNQLWSQASKGIADAPETDDGFGFALAAGDFDGDGFGDLAIGVPRENLEGSPTIGDAGAVHVIYGSPAGLTKAGSQFLTQAGAGPDAVPEEGDRFGSSLAAGDLNGDGIDDLAVGAPDEAIGSTTFAGGVSVLFGSAAGITTSGAQFWSQDSPGIVDSAEGGDGFGKALAVAGTGSEPVAERYLAIGVPLEDVGSVVDAGAVQVIYGSPSGPTDTGNQLWSQDSGGVKDVAEDSDQFGSALAAGDLDANGVADLAIGVPREGVGTVSLAGAVNVLYASATGISAAGNQLWTQDSGGIQESADFLDFLGTALAAGDFDGDGVGDLAVGVPGEPAPGGASAGGGINVIYGVATTGLAKAGNRFLWQDSGGFDDSTEPSDSFGRALAAADFGRGPEDDLAVGVPEEEVAGAPTASGAFHVVYGSIAGLAKDGNVLVSQDTPGVKDVAEVGDRMGDALAAVA